MWEICQGRPGPYRCPLLKGVTVKRVLPCCSWLLAERQVPLVRPWQASSTPISRPLRQMCPHGMAKCFQMQARGPQRMSAAPLQPVRMVCTAEPAAGPRSIWPCTGVTSHMSPWLSEEQQASSANEGEAESLWPERVYAKCKGPSRIRRQREHCQSDPSGCGLGGSRSGGRGRGWSCAAAVTALNQRVACCSAAGRLPLNERLK